MAQGEVKIKINADTKNLTESLAKAEEQVKKLGSQGFADTSKVTKYGQIIDSLTNSFKKFASQSSMNKNMGSLSNEVKKVEAGFNNVNNSVNKVASSESKITNETNRLMQNIKTITSDYNKMNNSALNTSQSLKQVVSSSSTELSNRDKILKSMKDSSVYAKTMSMGSGFKNQINKVNGLLTGMKTNIKGISGTATPILNNMGNTFRNLGTKVKGTFTTMQQGNTSAGTLKKSLDSLKTTMGNVSNKAITMGNNIKSSLNQSGSVNSLKNSVSGIGNSIRSGSSSLNQMGSGISNIGKSLGSVFKSGNVNGFTSALGKLGPVIGMITSGIKLLISAFKFFFGLLVKVGIGAINAFRAANEKLNNSMSFLGEAFRNVVSYAAMYFSVYKMVDYVKDAIKYASDLVEIENVVNITFEESAKVVDEFSKRALKDFGINMKTAAESVSTLGATFKSAGMKDNLAEASIALTKLTADFASFRNLNFDESFDKVLQGITGQTKGLRKLGITVMDVDLKQQLYALGIDRTTDSLSEQEKQMLRTIVIATKMTDVVGDFKRTQGTWANQTKLLSENMKEFLGIMGGALNSALLPVVRFLNSVVTRMQIIAKYIRAFFLALASDTKKVTDVVDKYGNVLKKANDIDTGGIESVSGDMEEVADSADNAKKSLEGVLSPLDDVAVMSRKTTVIDPLSVDEDIVKAFEDTINGLYDNEEIELPEIDLSSIQRAVDNILPYIEKLSNVFKKVGEYIVENKDKILKWIKAIGIGFLAFSAYKGIIKIISGIATAITTLLNPFMLLAVAIAGLTTWFAYLFQTNAEFRKGFLSTIGRIKEAWNSLKNTVSEAISRVFSQLKGSMDYMNMETLGEKIGILIADIITGFEKLIPYIEKAIVFIWDLGTAIIEGVLSEEFRSDLGTMADALLGLVQTVISFIGGVTGASNAGDSFGQTMVNAVRAIINIITYLARLLEDVATIFIGIIDIVVGLGTVIAGVVKIFTEGFKEGFAEIKRGLKLTASGIPEIGGGLVDFFPALIGKDFKISDMARFSKDIWATEGGSTEAFRIADKKIQAAGGFWSLDKQQLNEIKTNAVNYVNEEFIFSDTELAAINENTDMLKELNEKGFEVNRLSNDTIREYMDMSKAYTFFNGTGIGEGQNLVSWNKTVAPIFQADTEKSDLFNRDALNSLDKINNTLANGSKVVQIFMNGRAVAQEVISEVDLMSLKNGSVVFN